MRLTQLGVFAALALAATSAFSQTLIQNLPAGAALAGTEPVPTVQTAVTVKTTPAAIDTYVKTLGATLGVAKGGTNLTAATDDNVMVGNGTTWQSKAMPTCSGTTSALTYNISTNTFACNDYGLSGTFTATWSTGWTAVQTQTFSWTKTGNIVVLQSTSNLTGASNTTSAISDLTQLPAAITPLANSVVALNSSGQNNSVASLICAQVRANGSIAYGIPDATGSCVLTGFTASGTKLISSGTSGSGIAFYVYKTN